MPTFIYDFLDFLNGPTVRNIIFGIKIFSLVLSGILLFLIIFFLRKTNYLWNWKLYGEMMRMSAAPKGRISKKWQEILSRSEFSDEASKKLAIVEADVLVDNVLKNLGFSGETLSERMAKITSIQLKSVNDLRRAHEIRKNILYDPDFKVTPAIAKETIDLYEKVLKEIDVI